MLISGGTPTAKALFWGSPDVEVRKRGEQKGLDTPVVHAVNDDYCCLVPSPGSESQLTREIVRLRSTVARLKLKGIDGGSHKWWNMWFNSTQRA